MVLVLLALCGCASDHALPPPQVSTADFSVTPLPNNVFLIAYKGPEQTPRQRVLDLALLKASQAALEQKLDHFVIVDQFTSKPGEIKFLTALPDPGHFNNELLIQGFKGRPHRLFCFGAEATERAIYEKLRTAQQPEAL